MRLDSTVWRGPALAGRRLPPLPMAAGILACAYLAAFDLGYLWVQLHKPLASDLILYYAAAQVGSRSGWASMYDLHTYLPAQQALSGGRTLFLETPVMAWLVLPLARLPYPVAWSVWMVLLAGLSALSWWLLAGARLSGAARLCSALIPLSTFPFVLALGLGESMLLVIALVTIAWWLLGRGRQGWAGAALAVIAVKPQLGLLLPLALLAAGYRRVFLISLVAGIGLGLASLVAIGGPEGVRLYLATIDYNFRDHGSYLRFDTLVGTLGLYPGLALSVLVVVLVVLAARWSRGLGPDLPVAAGLVGSLLVATYLVLYDLTVLLAVAALLVRTRPPAWQGAIMAGLLLVGVLHNLLIPFPAGLAIETTLLVLVLLQAWLGRAAGSGNSGINSGSKVLSCPRA